MENEELLEFFKTLSNLERLKIVGLLSLEALTVPDIAARLKLAPVNVIRHIEPLQSLGLVKQADGSSETIGASPLSLDTAALEAMSRRVLAGTRPRFKTEDLEGEDYDRKVLGDYMTADGRLKSIPTQEKKLVVVLRYMSREFETGERYPEKQVNIMVARYYPDAAALRRYMVDNKLLARENGVYWKV